MRVLDVQADIDAMCDRWGRSLRPEFTEQGARRDFADAAAQARDAERETCSERLRARGVPHPFDEG
ncbi:MAG: hypothetical protein MI723_09045 [Caulobacterales bacterium]|nr:hypothetical protein [Caulobacterales bacterium]